MENTVNVTTFKDSRTSFRETLESHGIIFNERIQLSHDPMAAGIVLEIILTGGWGALAVACIAWANAKKGRKINVTVHKDKTNYWIEGYSAKDAEEILKCSSKIAVIDTKPDDGNS